MTTRRPRLPSGSFSIPHALLRHRYAGRCALAAVLCVLGACDGDSNGEGRTTVPPAPPPPPSASRAYRAIAGVSMGAYGAMNLGTKYPDLFGTVGSLGGPVDMLTLLRQLESDNLEVKPQTSIPMEVGDDFTFDHLAPYPDRDTRLAMARDLFIAFGNPFLHHPVPDRLYLAVDSEPAVMRIDDRFGMFMLPAGPRSFIDGGDVNEDGLRQTAEIPDEVTDVLLVARGTLPAPRTMPGVIVGDRALLDIDGDGVYDVGDGIVLNPYEPFQDTNGNAVYEPQLGESFVDVGLDGVPGTMDYSEGDGEFAYDPDRSHWLDEDPLSRLAGRDADEIRRQRIYMDVGTEDLFGFAEHYDNIVALLRDKGIQVTVQNGFSGDCLSVPEPTEQFLLIRYDGGHIGIPAVDDITNQLLNGDFCGGLLIWERLLTLVGFMNESFADGTFGPGGTQLTGEVVEQDIPSPALTPAGGSTIQRHVLVYKPPAYFNTDEDFPIVYMLGGYGQSPEDFERVGLLLDVLITAGAVQNMYFAFLPGEGAVKGSFYVNHVVPHEQVPGLQPSTGRYEDSIMQDLLPFVEYRMLEGRIRR